MLKKDDNSRISEDYKRFSWKNRFSSIGDFLRSGDELAIIDLDLKETSLLGIKHEMKYPYLPKSKVIFYTTKEVDSFQQAESEGVLHREGDLPAVQVFQEKDLVYTEYRVNGLLHREGDRPAVSDSMLDISEYRVQGELHRVGGPAYIQMESGNLYEEWWSEGKLNRTDGPAVIHYGTGLTEFYRDGVPYDPDQSEYLNVL